MVGSADIWKALNTAWDASTLDSLFHAVKSPTADHVVLHDQDASPDQEYPYCVVDQVSTRTISRMSGGENSLREIRDSSITFKVYVEEVSSDSRSAKQIAAYLAEEIMKVFGGHPTITATHGMTLDNGNMLITEYQTDYGVKTDDDEFCWVIAYTFRTDIPVAI